MNIYGTNNKNIMKSPFDKCHDEKKENINENEITTIFRTEKSDLENKISLEKQDLFLKGIN